MTNLNFQYTLKPSLEIDKQSFDLEPTINLLKAIQVENNLRIAANRQGYSYRKAWNLLKQWESLIGLALVNKHQGKGTQLTEVGKILLATTEESNYSLAEILTAASIKSNASLQSVLAQPKQLIIIASDSEKINSLREQMLPIELHIDGSGQALAAYANKKCDIAGFHLAMGNKNYEQFAEYSQFLDQKQDQFSLVEQRQQGIISHPDHPVHSIQEIADQQLVFVNRQCGSGTRLLLDSLLKRQGIKPNEINGYCHEEHTHLAVASMIASHQAITGLGIKSVATRLNLHFTPITSEYYFLVFRQLNQQIQKVLSVISETEEVAILDYDDLIKLMA